MTEQTPTPPSILKWVDDVPEPSMPPRPDKSTYEGLFTDLRNHPNEWALIGDGKVGVGAGSTGFLRSKGFQVRTRTIDETDATGKKLITVYARYFVA